MDGGNIPMEFSPTDKAERQISDLQIAILELIVARCPDDANNTDALVCLAALQRAAADIVCLCAGKAEAERFRDHFTEFYNNH
jgi:hypothetical protein